MGCTENNGWRKMKRNKGERAPLSWPSGMIYIPYAQHGKVYPYNLKNNEFGSVKRLNKNS